MTPELLNLPVVCVDSQFYFSVNLEEPSVHSKPEPEQVTVLVPESLRSESALEVETALPEPKVAKVKDLSSEPVAQKVEPPKKSPEAPEMIGKVVNHFSSFDQHVVFL